MIMLLFRLNNDKPKLLSYNIYLSTYNNLSVIFLNFLQTLHIPHHKNPTSSISYFTPRLKVFGATNQREQEESELQVNIHLQLLHCSHYATNFSEKSYAASIDASTKRVEEEHFRRCTYGTIHDLSCFFQPLCNFVLLWQL